MIADYNATQVDNLYFAGALIYNSETVATLTFSYLQFKFKIWDYFSNFI